MYGPLLFPFFLLGCWWLWKTFVPSWMNDWIKGLFILLLPLLMALDALRGSL